MFVLVSASFYNDVGSEPPIMLGLELSQILIKIVINYWTITFLICLLVVGLYSSSNTKLYAPRFFLSLAVVFLELRRVVCLIKLV